MISKKGSCILLFVILSQFSINSSILVYGYTFDTILICDEVDTGTKEPIGVGDNHLTYSGYIYCWINLTNVVKPLSIKFDWFQPDEELYRSSTIYTYSGYFPLLSVYDLMKVANHEPASNPGNWSVEVYVNNVFVAETKFILIDYSTMVDKVDSLETNVEDLTIAYDDLISQHILLQSNYDELLDYYENITYFYNIIYDDYNEVMYQKNNLESQYDNLVSDYDDLVLSHNDLLNEYDELISDYDSLVKKLNNTRNTMYGAIFGMIILLTIVAYLFTH